MPSTSLSIFIALPSGFYTGGIGRKDYLAGNELAVNRIKPQGKGFFMPGLGGYMRGFLYRQALRIKDFGEWMSHIRLLGIPILRPFCSTVICLGLALRERL
jgi:hypothetical protein